MIRYRPLFAFQNPSLAIVKKKHQKPNKKLNFELWQSDDDVNEVSGDGAQIISQRNTGQVATQVHANQLVLQESRDGA